MQPNSHADRNRKDASSKAAPQWFDADGTDPSRNDDGSERAFADTVDFGEGEPVRAASMPGPAPTLAVGALSDDLLTDGKQPNWLLESEGDRTKDALDMEAIEVEDIGIETSYVEPETTGSIVTRALAPAGLALLLSFGSVAGFALWKSSSQSAAPLQADPLTIDPSKVATHDKAELIAPVGSNGSAGSGPVRQGTNRAGEVVRIDSRAPSPARAGTTQVPSSSTTMPIDSGAVARASVLPSVVPQTPVDSNSGTQTSSSRTQRATSPGEVQPAASADEAWFRELFAETAEEPNSATAPQQGAERTDALLGSVLAFHEQQGATEEPRSPASSTKGTRSTREEPARLAQIPAAGAEGIYVRATRTETSRVAAVRGSEDRELSALLDGLLDERRARGGQPNSDRANETVGQLSLGTHKPAVEWVDTTPNEEETVLTEGDALGAVVATDSLPLVTSEEAVGGDWEDLAVHHDGAPYVTWFELEQDEVDFDSEPETSLDEHTTTPTESGPLVAVVESVEDPAETATFVAEETTEGSVGEPVAISVDNSVAPETALPNAEPKFLRGVTDRVHMTPVEPPAVGAPSDGVAPEPSVAMPEPLGPVFNEAEFDALLAGHAGRETAPAPEVSAATPTVTNVRPTEPSPTAVATTPIPTPTATVAEVSEPVVEIAPSPAPTEGATSGHMAHATGVVEVGPVAVTVEDKGPRSVLRRADEAGRWLQPDVPNSAVQGLEFLLTPNTGDVRVVFGGGDAFEGRLHGVGKGLIALDMKLGRMTLEGRGLVRIERIAPDGTVARTAERKINDTSGLEEVRVTVDGGVFTGHLVTQEGDRVTLILKEGYRMTVDALDVKPVGPRRASSTLKGQRPGSRKPGE